MIWHVSIIMPYPPSKHSGPSTWPFHFNGVITNKAVETSRDTDGAGGVDYRRLLALLASDTTNWEKLHADSTILYTTPCNENGIINKASTHPRTYFHNRTGRLSTCAFCDTLQLRHECLVPTLCKLHLPQSQTFDGTCRRNRRISLRGKP